VGVHLLSTSVNRLAAEKKMAFDELMRWLETHHDSIDELRSGSKLSSCNERSSVRISTKSVTEEGRSGVMQRLARSNLPGDKLHAAVKKLKQLEKDWAGQNALVVEMRLQAAAHKELNHVGGGAYGGVGGIGAGGSGVS
jgi:hypothetical protein